MGYLKAFLILIWASPIYAESYTLFFQLPENREAPALSVDLYVSSDTREPVMVLDVSESTQNIGAVIPVPDITELKASESRAKSGLLTWIKNDGFHTRLCPLISGYPLCETKEAVQGRFYIGVSHGVQRSDVSDVSVRTEVEDGALRLDVYVGLQHTNSSATLSSSNTGSSASTITKETFFLSDDVYFQFFTDFVRVLSSSDVFGFYGLYRTYDTPLKRKVFKRSQEYKNLKRSFAQVKRHAVGGPTFCSSATLETYDLKKKGFRISEGVYNSPRTLAFKYLGKNSSPEKRGLRDFISANEQIGLDVENGGLDVHLCYQIRALRIKTRKIPFRSPMLERMMSRRERAVMRRLTTDFEEFPATLTHVIQGPLDAPRAVHRVNRGRLQKR